MFIDEKHANEIGENVKCPYCEELLCKERGLQQNCGITNFQTNLNTQSADPKPPEKPENIKISTYKWGEYTNKQFEENVLSIYEKIRYSKNIFPLPSGKMKDAL